MTYDSSSTPSSRLAPRVAFYLLMSFLTLYITLFSIGGAWFELLNRWLPETGEWLDTGYAIRNFLAAIIVGLPIFLITHRFLSTSVQKNEHIRTGGAWKWLTYITLFVAGVVVLGNLIALVLNLLNGEYTLRFFLKVLVLGILAGGTFAYYFWDTREEAHSSSSPIPLIFHSVLTILGVLVVVLGLIFTGSPASVKKAQRDEIRAGHLSQIRAAIDEYSAEQKGKVPPALADALPEFRYINFPQDPLTGLSYEYLVSTNATSSYRLCATFETVSPPSRSSRPAYSAPLSLFQKHDAARTCYDLVVTPPSKSTLSPTP